MKRVSFVFGVLMLLAIVAAGCGGQSLAVTDIWSRPAAAGQTGAVYFLIANPAPSADTLLGATSAVAQAVEVHLSSMDANGVMKMTPQEKVVVPARGQASFKPGGLHIMLIGLRQELKPGDKFPVTLRFEKAGDVVVEATVREMK